MNERIEKIKKHFENNKIVYVMGTIFVCAGVTTLIMRERHANFFKSLDGPKTADTSVTMRPLTQPIGITTGDPAQSTIGILGQKVVIKDSTLNIASYISADRQGPPSWVVRCLETDKVFTSQRSAALAMGLAQDHLSNHLNGTRDDVSGFHFERVCLAA